MSFRKIGAAARVISISRAAGIARERRAHRVLLQQIAANQADVGLADLDERLPGGVVRRVRDVEAAVRHGRGGAGEGAA